MGTITIGPLPVPVVYVPFGKLKCFTVYIYNETDERWESLEYLSMTAKKQLNRMSIFEIETFDIDSDKKVYVKEGSRLAIFSENTMFLVGRIQTIEYESNYFATIQGFGMEIKLADKQFIKRNRSGTGETLNNVIIDDEGERVTYSGLSAQQIAEDLLSEDSGGSSPWVMEPDSDGIFDTDYGNISIRFENYNRLKSLAGLAEAIDYDWWIEQNDQFDTDYFNMASRKGSATSVKTYNISGTNTNCKLTNNEKDLNSVINKITMMGYGDGINQVRTTIYDASDVSSTLSSDITASDTTVSLEDGSSFPSSGILKIGREHIPYTSKSGNDFTVIRPDNAKEHRKGVLVYEWYDGSTSNNTQINSTNGITSKSCSIVLDDSSSFSSSGHIIVDSEIIKYDNNDGSTTLSTNNTTLNGEIDADDTTITLSDASSFTTTGFILVDNEIIYYTGKSSNDLTGCMRGTMGSGAAKHATGRTVYQFYRGTLESSKGTNNFKHPDNSIVFEYDSSKHYTDGSIFGTSAKTGSSIATNGNKADSITDRTLRDEPTAELIASREIIDKKVAVQRIKVKPATPMNDSKTISIGDDITINDDESDLSGDYRVVGLTLTDDRGLEDLEIEVSNKGLAFLEQVTHVRDQSDKEGKYMIGSTVFLPIGPVQENCGPSKPLNMRFYLPDDVIAINKAIVSYNVRDYRAYSSSSTSTNTEGSVVEDSSSGVATKTISYSSGKPGSETADLGVLTTSDGDEIEIEVFMSMNVTHLSEGSSHTFKALVSDGTNNYPGNDGKRIGTYRYDERTISGNTDNAGTGYTSADGNHNHQTSDSDNYDFVVASTGSFVSAFSTDDDGDSLAPSYYYVGCTDSIVTASNTSTFSDHRHTGPSHYHPFSDTYNSAYDILTNTLIHFTIRIPHNPKDNNYKLYIWHNDSGNDVTANIIVNSVAYSQHTHSVEYGIDETEGGSSSTLTISAGNDGSETQIGDTNDYSGTSQVLDVKDYLPSGTGVKNIKFEPSANCRVEATGYIKCFINS